MFLRTLIRPTGRKILVRALSALFFGALLLVQSSFVAAEQLDPAFDLPKGSEVAVARLLELRPDIPINTRSHFAGSRAARLYCEPSLHMETPLRRRFPLY